MIQVILIGMLWILLGPMFCRQRPNPQAELSDANDSDPKCNLQIVGLVEHSWNVGVKSL